PPVRDGRAGRPEPDDPTLARATGPNAHRGDGPWRSGGRQRLRRNPLRNRGRRAGAARGGPGGVGGRAGGTAGKPRPAGGTGGARAGPGARALRLAGDRPGGPGILLRIACYVSSKTHGTLAAPAGSEGVMNRRQLPRRRPPAPPPLAVNTTTRRLLSIGHSYVVGGNRQLAHAIQRAAGQRWEVQVVAPAYFHGG